MTWGPTESHYYQERATLSTQRVCSFTITQAVTWHCNMALLMEVWFIHTFYFHNHWALRWFGKRGSELWICYMNTCWRHMFRVPKAAKGAKWGGRFGQIKKKMFCVPMWRLSSAGSSSTWNMKIEWGKPFHRNIEKQHSVTRLYQLRSRQEAFRSSSFCTAFLFLIKRTTGYKNRSGLRPLLKTKELVWSG